MQAVSFPDQTTILGEGVPGANPIPIHLDPFTGMVTACYQMSPEELEEAQRNGGKVYVFLQAVPGIPYNILGMQTKAAFRELSEEEKKELGARNKSAKSKTGLIVNDLEERRARVNANRDKRNPNRLRKVE